MAFSAEIILRLIGTWIALYDCQEKRLDAGKVKRTIKDRAGRGGRRNKHRGKQMASDQYKIIRILDHVRSFAMENPGQLKTTGDIVDRIALVGRTSRIEASRVLQLAHGRPSATWLKNRMYDK